MKIGVCCMSQGPASCPLLPSLPYVPVRQVSEKERQREAEKWTVENWKREFFKSLQSLDQDSERIEE